MSVNKGFSKFGPICGRRCSDTSYPHLCYPYNKESNEEYRGIECDICYFGTPPKSVPVSMTATVISSPSSAAPDPASPDSSSAASVFSVSSVSSVFSVSSWPSYRTAFYLTILRQIQIFAPIQNNLTGDSIPRPQDTCQNER